MQLAPTGIGEDRNNMHLGDSDIPLLNQTSKVLVT